MPGTRVHVVMDSDLLRQVDEARGDIPRGAFIRRAVEQALGLETVPQGAARAPAESRRAMPVGSRAHGVETIQSSAQAKARVKPRPRT